MLQDVYSNRNIRYGNNKWEIFRSILMICSGIAIIKFILFFIMVFLFALSTIICMIGFEQRDRNGKLQDFGSIRRFFLFIPQFFARCALFSLGYYYIPEYYPANTPCNSYPSYIERHDCPRIIVANHVTIIDSLYFVSRCFPSVVGKAGVTDIWLIGWAIKMAFNPILVPTTDEQRRQLPDVKTQIKERLNTENINKPLLMFPEGSTFEAGYSLKYQIGAFFCMKSIQPIFLDYKYSNFDPSWTLNISALYLIFRLCCQFVNFLNVHYLDVINPDTEQGLTPEIYADKVRDIISKKGNLKKVNITNHDNYFCKDFQDDLVYISEKIYDGSNIQEIKHGLKLNTEQIKRIIKRFKMLDTDKDGFLSRDEFKKMTKNQIIDERIQDEKVNFGTIIKYIKLLSTDSNEQKIFIEQIINKSPENKENSIDKIIISEFMF